MRATSRDVRAAHYTSNGVLYDLDTPNTLISRNGVQAHHEVIDPSSVVTLLYRSMLG